MMFRYIISLICWAILIFTGICLLHGDKISVNGDKVLFVAAIILVAFKTWDDVQDDKP